MHKVKKMIEQVVINNFRSIRDCSLSLDRLNVLIGTNGVGKSNFIAFFELVHAIYRQKLGLYTLEHGGIDNILHFGRKESEFVKGLIDFANTNAFFFKLTPSQSNKGFLEYTGDFYNVKSSNGKDYSTWNKMIWDRAVEESEMKNQGYCRAKYINKYLDSFHIYHFHDTSKSSGMKRMCNVSDNAYLKDDASNLAAFLYLLSQKYEKEFKRIEKTIQSVAPYFDRFDLVPDRSNEQNIQLEWKEKNSEMYLNAHNFSDGTLRFIALTTLLLQPNLPEVILIDEPELGLHPAAINKLAALIRSASHKSQIIISTQSPNLVDCFEPEDIITVDREGRQSKFRRLKREDLTEWLEDYSIGDLWEKNIIGGQI